MKILAVLVACLAIFDAVKADAAADFAATNAFLECARKAIDGGLPSIPIPNHNPLVIQNFSYDFNAILVDTNFSVSDNILYNLLDYNFTTLRVDYSDNYRVNFTYDLYWPLLNFTGKWEIDTRDFIGNEADVVGTYNIVLHHTDFSGKFDLIKPGNEAAGWKENLDDFSLKITVKDIDVKLSGVGVAEVITEEAIKLALETALNGEQPTAAEFLRTKRFNEFWIQHPDRIKAIIDAC